MEQLMSLLLLCAVIAVLIAVVRSMLRYWHVWLGCVLGVMLLMLLFNIVYYGLLGNN